MPFVRRRTRTVAHGLRVAWAVGPVCDGRRTTCDVRARARMSEDLDSVRDAGRQTASAR